MTSRSMNPNIVNSRFKSYDIFPCISLRSVVRCSVVNTLASNEKFNEEKYLTNQKYIVYLIKVRNILIISCISGPVVFPEPPADSPMETSGVIPGASGFGFVPPNGPYQQSKR